MDKIQLAITEITPCDKSSLKEYDVQVIFNGVALKHNIFNAGPVVPASRFDFAEFDLFTCSCGIAGCAGFHNQVVQNKTADTVKWTFPDDKSYSVDKLEYEFDRVQFEQEFETLRSKMLELQKEKTHQVTFIRDENEYFGVDKEGDERFEVKDELTETFEWYESRYTAKQNFNSMLKEKFPAIHGKNIRFEYEGKTNTYPFDFNYAVCRAMNQWPEKRKEKAYLKRAEAAGKAVEKAIFENDKKNLVEIVHAAYKEFAEPGKENDQSNSFWHGFQLDWYEFGEEKDFDVNKLKISLA
jgi:hypothetical protein